MWYIVLVIVSSLVILSNGQHSTPIVNIQGLGLVQGSIGHTAWTNRTIYQFHAIPYAQSPVGELRFQPPVKTTSWSGTLNASEPGIQCPQLFGDNSNVENEDCLTLSVFSNNLDTARPVMVFIHGGWFFIGGASWHSPGYFLESDIVLVVIQYRLGPLGFLSTLSEKIPGNAGILDMIAALEWVQQHIGHFGGNPKQVTIFGQSAGSAAVSVLLHSPLVQGRAVPLFQRAILQSGSVFSPWALCDTPKEGALDIARRLLDCNELVIEPCLQRASVKSLLEAFGAHRKEMIQKHGYSHVTGTNVVVGGPSGLFPKHPKNYLWNANENIAVMGGATSQDGLFLLDEILQLQPELLQSLNTSHDLWQFVQVLHGKFGQDKIDGVLEGYALLQNFLLKEIDQVHWKDIAPGLTDICGNHGIKGPVLTDIQAFSRVNPENVYLYSFDYSNMRTETNLSFPFPYEGIVHHGEEQKYLFPGEKLNDEETKVAKMMIQLWTSFAIKGTPSAKDAHYWPPANRLYGPYLKIDKISEQKNYYLNEFSVTSDKYRTVGSGCGRISAAVVSVVLIVIIKILIF